MKATSVGQIVAALTKAMSERYAADPSRPCVLISHVDDKFYVTLKRFERVYGEGGYNIAVRTGDNLFETVKDIAQFWLETGAKTKTATDALIELVA